MPTKKSLEEIQQAMAVLQASFWSTLGLKSAQFNELAQLLRQGDLTVFPAIISLAHQLAGSCGTFQFQHLGQLARQIEVHAINAHRVQLAELYILEPLVDAIERFVAEVNQGAAEPGFQVENQLALPQQRQDIWLVLAPSALRDELNAQLHAFGYQITTFATFSECVSALRKQAPALLFCAATLADQSLFSQYELLQSVNEKQSWLMIFSEIGRAHV